MAREQARRTGARGRERRVELDLTQRNVAERINERGHPGVDSDQVSGWERGEHTPRESRLEAWADALETTVADLYAGPKAERKQKPAETPDLEAALNGDRSQLDRIEQKLDALLRRHLSPLTEVDEAEAADIRALLDRRTGQPNAAVDRGQPS